MANKIQGKHLDEIRVKMAKKWKKTCKAKYGVVLEIQHQNGVVVFCNLKDATIIVLARLGINNIGYLLHTSVFFNSSTYLNG